VLALYHRAQTFGGSFNSVLDVLSRVEGDRFAVTAAVPGPGNARDAFARLGIPVHVMSEHPGGYTAGFASAVASAWWYLRRHRTALVYVADHVTWRSSALTAARLARVPSVVHLRSPRANWALDPELLRATIIVGNSEATVRAVASRRAAGTVRVIYNFVDFASFEGARDRRSEFFPGAPPVVGFLGVFRPEKGIEYFLQMAQQVASRRPDVRFLAVGGESAVSDIGWFVKMREYAAQLGVGHLVHFTGSRDDVPDMLKSMDILVVPSLNEGFGRVIIEANAVGTPVIGADAAGIPEVVEDGRTGLLVPPRDPDSLTTATLKLLDDQAWRQRLSQELPGYVRRRFAPEQQMQALQQAWDDALAYSTRA
jgi:glycosyltransferase involved in cell wall biosynthesis